MPVDPATGDDGCAVESGYVVAGGCVSCFSLWWLFLGDLRSEEACEEVTNQTTNGVHGEDIERVIDVQQVLDLRGEVTGDSADDTEYDGGPRWYEARRRSDGDQASDDTRAETHSRPLTIESVIEQGPCDSASSSSGVRHEARHDGADVSSERRATVEAEPAHPQEDRAEDDVRYVMGTVWQACGGAVSGALPEHHGVGESSSAGGDVNRGSAGEIESAEEEGPAVRVPCPTGDGVVD